LSLSIHPLADPALVFDLSHVAGWRAYGPPARYQITQQSLARAVAWGYPVRDIRLLLHQALGDVLPQEAAMTLDGWCTSLSHIRCEAGYRIRTAAPHVLDELRQRKPFARRTCAFASRQDAWVHQSKAQALFAYLQRLGYVVQPPEDERLPLLPPALRKALPLPQLLVALRTYAHLRDSVPGLGAPDLEPLEREIAAVLEPEQLAGVQQVVESNVILLAWAGEDARTVPAKPPQPPAVDKQALQAQEGPVPVPPAPQPDLPARLEAALETLCLNASQNDPPQVHLARGPSC
jgi:hypothetical protein